ncbi:MAG: MoaD/ThiS family protein [Chloroflexi bacterium]|nr:MoaD/ThiS family protein [Chloroflexota bacterium]
MSVKIDVYPGFAHLTGGQTEVEVNGSTVGQCLEQLVARYPKIKKTLYRKDGTLSCCVEIWVNLKTSYPEELDMPVKDGDELRMLGLMITG